jgi:hypothetical protein
MMIKIIRFILFFVCIGLVPLKAQTNKFMVGPYDNSIRKSEFLLYLSKNYSTCAYSILSRKRFDFYTKWASGKWHFQILSSYAAVVHETCHAVNSDIGGFFSLGFFISPGIEIELSQTDVYETNEIDQGIPKSWKTGIFRYKTYIQGIKGEDQISTISDGIYGLMDEFDAYYQSTKAVVELYNYYKTFADYREPYYWALYLSNCSSSIYAYFEFKLFIAWYLKYARKNHPRIYQTTLQNKNLKVVYSLIDEAYKKVINQYFVNRKIILDNINKAGKKKAEISNKFFMIKTKLKDGYSGSGYGIPDSEITYLKSLFTIEDYLTLDLLKIKNISETNYKKFLD